MKSVLIKPETAQEQYLNVKRVAARLDTSPATIWRWTAAGTFPRPSKLSPGSTRWKLSDIEKWEAGRG